ncbi:hypothetical protein O7599_27955 [Streptomyces sp. WMMC500]|uniref:hypothetical protein n=1 Tax=Streptomyces sp. WMMC500 TaxID=3015154 RepID=UPI00248D0FCE|nr:hypothetical protein [Streptomyces sp. WMMC500]WBB59378.1 hypothetical protein O7599_27955 [Streptomyces sp. WMMC500]
MKYVKSAVVLCGAALALGAAGPAGAIDPGLTNPDLSLDAAAAQAVEGLVNQPTTELVQHNLPVDGPEVREVTRPVDDAAHDVMRDVLPQDVLAPAGVESLGGS